MIYRVLLLSSCEGLPITLRFEMRSYSYKVQPLCTRISTVTITANRRTKTSTGILWPWPATSIILLRYLDSTTCLPAIQRRTQRHARSTSFHQPLSRGGMIQLPVTVFPDMCGSMESANPVLVGIEKLGRSRHWSWEKVRKCNRRP